MVNRDDYGWPKNFSDFYVCYINIDTDRRMYRWQAFFIDPKDGAIYVLKDRNSGELTPVEEWTSTGHWPGLWNIERDVLGATTPQCVWPPPSSN